MRIKILFVSVLLVGCVSLEEKHKDMVSDATYGIALVKADNNKAVLSATLAAENISTGEITEFPDAIYAGNRGKPVIFKLKPGVYRLYKYKLYTNLNPSLTHLNFVFEIKPGAINYLGDWHFKEHWSNGSLRVDFSIDYSEGTVKEAKKFFQYALEKWPLKERSLP